MKNPLRKWFVSRKEHDLVVNEKNNLYQKIISLEDALAESRKNEKSAFRAGFSKGRERLQKTPGYFRDEIHSKLNQIFGTDKPGKNAQFRWLRQHTMKSSHMSEMSKVELMQVNDLLDRMLKGEVV